MHTIGSESSKRRALGLQWDSSTFTFSCRAVKVGSQLVWHHKEDMQQAVRGRSADIVSFDVGSSFILRSMITVKVAGISVPPTKIYFQCVVVNYNEIGK